MLSSVDMHIAQCQDAPAYFNAESSARSYDWDEVMHTMLHCNAFDAYFMLLILFDSSTTSSLRTKGYQSNWQLP
jgi:hypothetical protein